MKRAEAPPAAAASAAPSRRLLATLAVAVLTVAAVGYWQTGSPSLARTGLDGSGAAPPATAGAPATSASGASALQQIATMVDKLAERMKEQPDDAEGWTMLARSYTVLGRFADALPAYRRATELLPNNANLLADYADAVAATKGGANNAESAVLIERALRVDPNHVKALALAGTAAYDRGDFAGAVASWQKIVDRLPPGSELAQQVQASIVEAREHASGTVAQAAAAARPPTPAPAPARDVAPAAAAGVAGKVSGTVTLDPALRGQAGPDDTVFVFARPANGGRMPLAVLRAKVADLPLAFTLDDSMAMAPGMTISSAKQLTVSARISKSGNALPQSGDLSGEAATVAPGASGIAVRIGSVVGKP
jgi:cytochrome c-type biogenesis protein CcmH